MREAGCQRPRVTGFHLCAVSGTEEKQTGDSGGRAFLLGDETFWNEMEVLPALRSAVSWGTV